MTRIGLKPALISLAGLACLFAVLHAHPSTADDEADLLSQSVPGPRVELSDDPDDPGELPEDVTADQHQTQVRVDAFLQTMIAKFGADLWASVDWEKQQIRLVGASAAMSELKTFDGQLVAGMAVTVSKAEIDRHQYEAAIAPLTAAKVSLPIEIASFGLPAHSEFIDIKVLNLSRHPADLVQEFRTQIARLLEVPFRLTEAPPENWTDRGDSQAPWTGGVQMRHNVGSAGAACSTAFSVVKGGTGYVPRHPRCTSEMGRLH
ncbi:hypothetical protein [Nocardioides daejeonensis]|uniref:hypothetical protein n=1 Tax=Nocardioides daejeonensis TaxID=1046556 RepID=UPI000D74DE0A|nr:hypothetical protein [Nocardioides daejeonensis]